jgi:transposase
MAVERVQEGEAPSVVIAWYGFCRTTIYMWLRLVKRGGGSDPLRSRPATGRPAKLTAKQARQVFGWIKRQRSATVWLRFWSMDAAHCR